jgi:hypothetical protein
MANATRSSLSLRVKFDGGEEATLPFAADNGLGLKADERLANRRLAHMKHTRTLPSGKRWSCMSLPPCRKRRYASLTIVMEAVGTCAVRLDAYDAWLEPSPRRGVDAAAGERAATSRGMAAAAIAATAARAAKPMKRPLWPHEVS